MPTFFKELDLRFFVSIIVCEISYAIVTLIIGTDPNTYLELDLRFFVSIIVCEISYAIGTLIIGTDPNTYLANSRIVGGGGGGLY